MPNKKTVQVQVPASVIEAGALRLSTDETRLILKALNSPNSPVLGWGAQSLTGLGIMKAVPKLAAVEVEDRSKKLWSKLQQSVAGKNLGLVSKAVSELEDLKRDAEGHQFVLTALGRQIARKITVKLNSQYLPKK
jgi:hypothetical protein